MNRTPRSLFRRTSSPSRPWAPFLPSRLSFRGPLSWLHPGRLWSRRRSIARWGLVFALTFGCAHRLAAATGDVALPNLALPTAGGQQLWADLAWESDWRIQRNVLTSHCRLLDGDDVRRAWGSEKAMDSALLARREAGDLRAPRRRCVVLLHGLWRTRDSLAPMKAAFGSAGYDVLDLGYPSTRASVAAHAEQVAAVLERLPHDYESVSFVTHSLGALVVRQLLTDEAAPWRSRHGLEKGRAVFIAAPNSGAALAGVAKSIPGAFLIYGEPSQEIAGGLAAELPAPGIPFLTIAAGRGTEEGWNPLIPGDDDGVVGVSEAGLEGACEQVVVEGIHTFVMQDPSVVELAVEFVCEGRANSPAHSWISR